MSEYRYRFVDTDCEFGPRAILQKWIVHHKTEKGAWILPPWAVTYLILDLKELHRYGLRFVLDGDGKRFAHETEELALNSYKRRKQRQLQYARATIERAEQALEWLETGREPEAPLVI